MRYVRRRAAALSAALFLAALVGLFEAASTVLIAPAFDMFLGGSPTPVRSIPGVNIAVDFSRLSPPFLLALLVGATIARAASEYGAATATAYLGHAVVRDLRNDVFNSILKQPLEFFTRNHTADLISRVSSDVERIQTAVSETLAEFLKQSAILLFSAAVVFWIDWKLSLASLAFAPLVLYATSRFGKRLRTLSRSNQQELGEMAQVIYEAFSGNRIVKAFLMEESEGRRFRRATERLFRTNLRQKMTHALSSPLMETLGILIVAGFLVYARNAIAEQRITASFFVVFVVGLVRLYDAFRRISGITNSFQQAFGASSRIVELLEMAPEEDAGAKQLTGFSESIEFRNVTFGYTPDAPVLQDISFSVRRGEVVAIVGPSGAGKTTLVNLLPRFYSIDAGRILIDGVDVRDYSLASLRRRMAIVTQDVILFDDTIWANIAYGDANAPPERVMNAAKAALVDEFASLLPDKYQTRIGERGLRLSGGERQRISIARALLKNAPILILDEATSSLDAESEVEVQRALQNLMEGRTTIVIAHRLSTIRGADKIVVLVDGRVEEAGRHEDLLARRGAYWKLYNLQFSAESAAQSK